MPSTRKTGKRSLRRSKPRSRASSRKKARVSSRKRVRSSKRYRSDIAAFEDYSHENLLKLFSEDTEAVLDFFEDSINDLFNKQFPSTAEFKKEEEDLLKFMDSFIYELCKDERINGLTDYETIRGLIHHPRFRMNRLQLARFYIRDIFKLFMNKDEMENFLDEKLDEGSYKLISEEIIEQIKQDKKKTEQFDRDEQTRKKNTEERRLQKKISPEQGYPKKQ